MKDPVIDRMEEEMKDLGRSLHTRRIYLQTVTRLKRDLGGSLEEAGPEEVQKWMRDLIRSDKLSAQSLSVYAAAVRFLFKVTLRRPEVVAGVRTPRKPVKLPTVMSANEVRRCLQRAGSERNLALIMLGYGAGLRIRESRHVQVPDILSAEGALRVQSGKGRKERLVMLSTVLLAQLRKAWLEQRPEGPWLFPGQRRNEPLGARQVRKVWEMAQVRAGLRRHYPYHALRGAFATHLLDGGAALQTIQVLLGHARLSSTTRYVAVQANHVKNVQSPLDRLVQEAG
jgi:site-specific recombinase XerD